MLFSFISSQVPDSTIHSSFNIIITIVAGSQNRKIGRRKTRNGCKGRNPGPARQPVGRERRGRLHIEDQRWRLRVAPLPARPQGRPEDHRGQRTVAARGHSCRGRYCTQKCWKFNSGKLESD